MAGRAFPAAALLLALCGLGGGAPQAAAETSSTRAEPNTRVPAGVTRYAPTVFPDRIVVSPAQDAATGLAVAWRTAVAVEAPLLEIVIAGDSPDMGPPRQLRASTRLLETENGAGAHHRVEVD